MDLQPIHHQEATSSVNSSTRSQFPQQDSSSSAVSSTETQNLRSSARVKAAKQKSQAKDKGKERNPTITHQQPSSHSVVESSEIVVPRTTRATTNFSKPKRSRDKLVGKTKAKAVSDKSLPRTSKRFVY